MSFDVYSLTCPAAQPAFFMMLKQDPEGLVETSLLQFDQINLVSSERNEVYAEEQDYRAKL